MPSDSMDQRRQLPYSVQTDTSSFFSEELRLPTERQAGLWRSDSLSGRGVTGGALLMPGNKSLTSSQLGKLHLLRASPMGSLELSQPFVSKNQNDKHSLKHPLVVSEKLAISTTSETAADNDATSKSLLLSSYESIFAERNKVNMSGSYSENGFVSSSLSDSFDRKLTLTSTKLPSSQSVDAYNSNFEEDEPLISMEEIEARTIGNLLPDDDELLSGVIDDIGYIGRSNNGDDIDDIFYSGGGMELEVDDNMTDNFFSDPLSGGTSNGLQGGLTGTFAGEHPFGEHPSRTLFVRNINSNVEDAELRVLFEHYGDIRTLYTACKHRGFVMISYYDIRSARNAMRALQNKPLRRRKLDIHFSIPKDNPSEKDVNQGTLVIFNLDSSVSNDDLLQIFGVYGEIKEIRETPHKRHHKFIEFYDVRAAEAALRALNKSDIAGKKIKLEPSRPGGARRCLVQQLSPELEQDELNGLRQWSPNNSLSGSFGSVPLGSFAGSSLENGIMPSLNSAVQAPTNPLMETTFHGISSSVPQSLSSAVRIASVGNHKNNQVIHGDVSHSLSQMNLGYQRLPNLHPHSLPEYNNGVTNGIPYSSTGIPPSGVNINFRAVEGITNNLHKMGSGSISSHSFDHNEGAFDVSGNGSCPLHGNQYAWSNSSALRHHSPGPMLWPNSQSLMNSISHPTTQVHGVPRAPTHMLNTVLPLQHHVGSAPSVNSPLWERRHSYIAGSADPPGFHPGSLGNMGFSGSPQLHSLELASRSALTHNGGNSVDPSISPAHVGISSPQQRCQIFQGRNPMIPIPSSFDGPTDRIRSRRNDSSANQVDTKKQYELDIERIVRGEDSRTTLMIKNIPNKYTSKMLLAAIDENHRGTYDFIYLPIDFKNKCNVGYAFINMIDPQHIVSFYQSFNGKKWEKFNSEKVATLAYARIQGKSALVAHFQNSSLMNEDKRCRPIIFHSDGPNAGDQEPFPMGSNIRSRSGRLRTAGGSEENNQGSPSGNGNGVSEAPGSPPDSSKDFE